MKPTHKITLKFTSPLPITEEKIINDYWLFDFDKEPYRFHLNITAHKQKTGLSTNQINKILEQCEATCSHPAFKCTLCANTFFTSSRKYFLAQFKKNAWLCEKCETQKIQKEIKPYVDNLFVWDEYNNQSFPKISFKLNELDFIELTALYMILKELSSDKKTSNHATLAENYSLTGNTTIDEQLLERLTRKIILKKINISDTYQNPDYQKILEIYSNSICKPQFIRKLIKKFDNKLHHAKPGSYMLLPNIKTSDYEEILSSVGDELDEYKVSVDELKNIEKYIDEILLSKAFNLLKIVQDSYRFPIKKSIRVERILKTAMNLLTLEQAYGWINWIGKKTARDIHDNRNTNYQYFNKFQENYIFLNRLESYLNLIEKEERKSFHKILPSQMLSTSLIERYFSEKITHHQISWITLTGTEIKELIIKQFL